MTRSIRSVLLAVGFAATTPIAAQRPPLAFVSNEGSCDETVIDLSTGATVGSIPVGGRPRAIYVSPDGARVYVAISDHQPQQEGSTDAIAAIAIATRKVI